MTAVSEYIFFSRMPMQIQKHLDSAFVFEDHFFETHDFGGSCARWVFPLSIHIEAINVAARVPDNDPIRIDHGDYFNNEIVKQLLHRDGVTWF